MRDFSEESTRSLGYTVLIGGGSLGVQSRITGSIPRRFTEQERAKLRATLARGAAIEVRCASAQAWEAMRRSLFRQLGIVA